jgi:hypothetical protein
MNELAKACVGPDPPYFFVFPTATCVTPVLTKLEKSTLYNININAILKREDVHDSTTNQCNQ